MKIGGRVGRPDRVVVRRHLFMDQKSAVQFPREAKIDDHKKAHHLERAGDPPGSNFALKPKMQLRHKGFMAKLHPQNVRPLGHRVKKMIIVYFHTCL